MIKLPWDCICDDVHFKWYIRSLCKGSSSCTKFIIGGPPKSYHKCLTLCKRKMCWCPFQMIYTKLCIDLSSSIKFMIRGPPKSYHECLTFSKRKMYCFHFKCKILSYVNRHFLHNQIYHRKASKELSHMYQYLLQCLTLCKRKMYSCPF